MNPATTPSEEIAKLRADAPTRRCQNCRFWQREYPDPEMRMEWAGHCRLKSPTFDRDAYGREKTLWPATFEWDWCGEHHFKGEHARMTRADGTKWVSIEVLGVLTEENAAERCT